MVDVKRLVPAVQPRPDLPQCCAVPSDQFSPRLKKWREDRYSELRPDQEYYGGTDPHFGTHPALNSNHNHLNFGDWFQDSLRTNMERIDAQN